MNRSELFIVMVNADFVYVSASRLPREAKSCTEINSDGTSNPF
ncbi:hypothetical protein [Priestia megaterium]|nr:hypothetical protein [Priestia megaterium]